MKGINILTFFAVIVGVAMQCVAATPTRLTCEYCDNPVGVEAAKPRLSWWLPEGTKEQKAYRIVVEGHWDSGWVESDQSVNVPYGGKALDDLAHVTWKVNVRTDLGESGWSESAHWTQGKRVWTAKWIRSKPHAEKVPDDRYVIRIKGDKVYTLEVNGKIAYRTFSRSDFNRFDFWRYADITDYVKNDGTDVFKATEGTIWERVTETPSHGAPAFRKRFAAAKEVKRAVLAISGLGYYEASLDGKRVGAKRLDPIPTNYDKRVYYSVYELGGLAAGQHELDVLLGHGWYDVYAGAVWSWDGAPWRDDPKLLAELRLEYADGTCETIATDETWRRVGNPVWYDNVREGEVIGPRPDIDEQAILADAPKGTLAAETQPGSVIAREIAPQKIKPLGGGDYLVDFGENIAGWMRMKMRGLAKGDVVHVRYDERVNEDFTPCTTNRIITWHFRYSNSWAFPGKGGFQIDRYIASGDSEETYEPRFTYNGFRYVLIQGLKSAPTADDLRACVLHTGFKTAGSFDCSDKDFLDVLKMADRAYRGNFANGYPTDCPHREKNGWTGDANLAAELAQYSYENTAAYEGWCVELRDAQREDGHMPGICPTAGWGYGGYGPVWDSVLTALPANLRKYRGDTRIVELLRDAQRKYVEYYSTNPLFSTNGIIYYGYGDWCPAKTFTRPAITSTGYFIAACEEVGRGDLAANYRKASIENFYKGDGIWENGSQTAQACALNFKLYDGENMRQATVEKLVKSVHDADDHIDFGLVGSKQVFRALSEAGYTELAYKMATQHDYPSFLYWRDNGGTTFMEEWKLSAPSQNHVMFADVVAWSYQYLAGIREVENGFKTFTLAPDVIPQLDHVSASVETPYGIVKSAWRREGDMVKYCFTIPPGTSAKVRFASVNKTFGPGSHEVSSSAWAEIDRTVMGDKYWEIWNESEQARIDADIERNRKADGTFAITAADGSEVQVEQLENEFRFGAHIFNYNQLGNREYNERYKAMYGKGGLFNQATVSFYWIDHEQSPGVFRFGGGPEDAERYWNSMTLEERQKDRNWRRPAPGPVINFLRAKGLSVHGHCVIWGNGKPYWIYDWFCPESEKQVVDSLGVPRHSEHYEWEPAGRNEIGYLGKWCTAWRLAYCMTDERQLAASMPVFTKEMRRIFRKRVFDVAVAYGGCADSWDIVNESAGDWMRYRSSKTGLPVWFSNWGLMPGDYPLYAFLDAKEAFPESAKLAINDFQIDKYYAEQTREILDAGGRIDIVGLQMHIFNTNDSMRLSMGYDGVRWVGSPKKIRDTLDVMARNGKPLHISEVTIAAPGVDDRSREIQAILTRNIYRAWFSHPSTMGITWWNTVDGAGVAGEPLVSGLYTDKMEKKPVYHVLDELVNREWTTRTTAKAKDGAISFRGFKGKYRLSWKCRDCGETHERIVMLSGDGAREAGWSWKTGMCRMCAKDFVVDGKPVTIGDSEKKLDLKKIYPEEARKDFNGKRVATVVVKVSAPSSGRYAFMWHNDYFGEISINGGEPRKVDGPWLGFERMDVDLKKGVNIVEFKTRAGRSGSWTVGFQVMATSGLSFVK